MDKVLIGVATRGHIHVGTVRFLLSQKHEVCFGAEGISATIARSIICRKFLKGDYTHLFFLDDDINPPKDVIDKLLKHDKDVICANYYLFLDGRLHCAAYTKKGDNVYEPYDLSTVGMKEVDGIGLGACLIKRAVIKETLKIYDFSLVLDEEGYLSKGEDITFSEAVKIQGFPIHYDFNTICQHHKEIGLQDMEQFITS